MSEQPYLPPGPGTWELDTTHFSRPVSRYCADSLPDALARGFQEGTERYGLFVTHLKYVFINGFAYMKPMLAFVPEDAPPGPPPEGFFEQPALIRRFENGPKAIEGKLWRSDLERWDNEVKPDSVRRNQSLQDVDLAGLSDEELAGHLTECRDNVVEMFYRHHIFSVPSIIATGHYVDQVSQLAEISAKEALDLLKGSSPVSVGIAADELAEIGRLLEEEGLSPDQFAGKDPAQILETLRSRPGPIGSAIERYLDLVGYQIASGYDITERYLLELPEVLVGNLWSSRPSETRLNDAQSVDPLVDEIRGRVPESDRDRFDSLLEEARHMNRLRDERSVYNDCKAVGLARRAALEAGRRLEGEGELDDGSLLVFASHDEMLSLLRDEPGPSPADLRARKQQFESKSIDDVPQYLGPAPQPPPPPEALPEVARLAASALGAALGNLFDVPMPEKPDDAGVTGLPVSPGTYEGTARLVLEPADLNSIQRGDVLVSRNTSAAFNAVLPLLGAIVTDRGGQLSHAAIVSREYGIPGVVSTRNATRAVPNGARVRVDGSTGSVQIL